MDDERRNSVRINFRLPREVEEMLRLYQAQTGILMSAVIRQVCCSWLDSTVHLRGALNFGSSSKRTGIWMPRALADALEAKIKPLSLTRGQVISRLVYDYLKARLKTESQPSQNWRQNPELFKEGLQKLYEAIKDFFERPDEVEITPDMFMAARSNSDALREAMALASDLLEESRSNERGTKTAGADGSKSYGDLAETASRAGSAD